MGLWPWGLGGMLTPKFFKTIKNEGFLKTWLRGFQYLYISK